MENANISLERHPENSTLPAMYTHQRFLPSASSPKLGCVSLQSSQRLLLTLTAPTCALLQAAHLPGQEVSAGRLRRRCSWRRRFFHEGCAESSKRIVTLPTHF
jgi:hypothetical protein